MSDTGPSAETLTIMMTDVEGSTALRRTRGDPLADEILELHGVIVRDQLGRCGGRSASSSVMGSSCPSRHRWPQSGAPSAFSVR